MRLTHGHLRAHVHLFTLGLLALGCVMYSPIPARAQSQDKAEAEKDSGAAAEQKPATPPTAEPRKETAWDRLIYLPYKQLQKVLDRDGGSVLLPYAEYLQLWRESQAKGKTTVSRPPVQAVVTRAEYSAQVREELASITAKLTVQALKPGWSEISLRFGDAAVGKMTASHEKIVLRGVEEGCYALLLPEAGEHTVELELVTRVRSSPEGRRLALEVPSAGMTTFEVSVPGADQTIEVTPHRVAAPVESDEGTTRVRAHLGATRQIAARWFPRVTETPEMELLTTVSNRLNVHVAEGLLHTEATLHYRVLRGELREVQFVAPRNHRILDVTAPGLKNWKSVREENRQVVTVERLSGSNRDFAVEVRSEAPLMDQDFPVAGIDEAGNVYGIHSLGAVRESGTLILGHSPELVLTVEKQQGVLRIDAATAQQEQAGGAGSGAEPQRAAAGPMTPIATPPAPSSERLYYKFYAPQFVLRASAAPVQPRLVVDHQTRVEIREDEIRLAADLNYDIQRAGVFQVRLRVPEGVTIDAVESEQRQDHTLADDGRELIVSLREKTQGALSLSIRGRQETPDEDAGEFPLPLLEPLDIARENGRIQIYAPEAVEIVTSEESVVGVQPDPTATAQTLPNLRLASAWTFNRRPVEISVTMVRRPTRLSAEVATSVDFGRELIEVSTLLDYAVTYAGVDTFRFAVPEAVSERLQIETADGSGPAIKQRSAAPAEEGWVTWTIVMQRDVLGKQRFQLRYDLKPESKQDGTTVLIEPVRPLGLPGAMDEVERIPLARVTGEIVVRKDRALAVAAEPKDLESIDLRELRLLPAEGALAYRYFRQPVELRIDATRHDVQNVVQTVVTRGLVEAVVSRDDAITYRCRYQLRTSERQRLAVELPAQSEVLGGAVAGRQINQLEKGPSTTAGFETWYLPTARSDEPFYLTLLFRVPARPLPRRWLGGELDLPLPRIGGTEARESGDVATQQLRVVVWVPEEYALVGRPEDFTIPDQPRFGEALVGRTYIPVRTTELDAWMGDSGGVLFDFTVAGQAFEYQKLGTADRLQVTWWRSSWMTAVLSIAVFLIAVVLSGTSWENRLGVVLIATVLAALYALVDANLVLHLLAAMRFGLAAGLAWWILRGLARMPLPSRSAAAVVTSPPAPGPQYAAVIPPPGVFHDFRTALRDSHRSE